MSDIEKHGIWLTKVDLEGNKKSEDWACNACEKKGRSFLYDLINSSTSPAIGHLRESKSPSPGVSDGYVLTRLSQTISNLSNRYQIESN